MTSGLRTVSVLTFLSRVLGLRTRRGHGGGLRQRAVDGRLFRRVPRPQSGPRHVRRRRLTAAFLPAFLQERAERGEQAGWRLASGVIAVLTIGLTALVLGAELILAAIWTQCEPASDVRLLIGLTAVLLPYLVLVCVVAQLNAVMYGLNHFLWPSLEPVLANVVWIACLWWLVPWLDSPTARIYAVALAIVGIGILSARCPAADAAASWIPIRGGLAEIAIAAAGDRQGRLRSDHRTFRHAAQFAVGRIDGLGIQSARTRPQT